MTDKMMAGVGILMELVTDKGLTKLCPNIEEGIDIDGIVDGHLVETYYAELEQLILADGYLRVIGDSGFTNTEIRVPLSTLEDVLRKRAESKQ